MFDHGVDRSDQIIALGDSGTTPNDLTPFVGQTVQVRWRFTSDPGSEYDGFYLDQVQLGTPGPSDVVFADGFEGGAGSDFMCH